MKEVKPLEFGTRGSLTGRACPKCGGDLVTSQIPCPEGKRGCLVVHHGYRCLACGAYWTN